MKVVFDPILRKLRADYGGGTSPADVTRITNLENNEYKILYFEAISTATGTITKPVGSTILLDQFYSGGDAVVETLVNGQPTGQSPLTAGGAVVSVSSFDASGNFTLSGTPSSFNVALVYIIKIPALYFTNLVMDNIMAQENYNTNLIVGTSTIGSGSNTKVLYNNNGIVGEYTISGTGSVAMTTSPVFVTDITTPKVIGGSGVASKIDYTASTHSGVTTTAIAHQFNVGNSGGTLAAQIYHNGLVSINSAAAPVIGQVRITQASSFFEFGERTGSSGYSSIWLGRTIDTPTSSNYTLQTILNYYTVLNAVGENRFAINGTLKMSLTASLFTPSVDTSISGYIRATKTTEQARIGYSSGIYWTATTNAAGLTTFDASGGTANFKFNKNLELTQTVSVISPTSPDRTVAMVVNGTTIYLHGKTTND